MRFHLFILVFVSLTIADLLNQPAGAAPKSRLYAQEINGNLNIITPWGSRFYLGDSQFAQLQSYAIEIPSAEFKPLPIGEAEEKATSSINENNSDAQISTDLDSFIVEANQLYNKGKFKEALQTVNDLLKREPQHVRGLIMKGSLLHAMGHKDLAKKSWEQAQKLEPNNTEIKNIIQNY